MHATRAKNRAFLCLRASNITEEDLSLKRLLYRLLVFAAIFALAVAPALAAFKLQYGDKDAAVLEMQQALNRLGYGLKADGSFGQATEQAVRAFQRQNGLTVDGVAGERTLALLYAQAGTQTAAPTAAPGGSASASSGRLERGDTGSEVLALQKALNKLGFSLKEDGNFGSGTLNAVLALQRKYGLQADGIVGGKTRALIDSLSGQQTASPLPTAAPTAAQPTQPPAATAAPRLERGDTGSEVLRLQQALNKLGFSLKEDGNFGSGTVQAVKAFQRQNGLEADGIAGRQTLALLYAQETSAPQPTASPLPTQNPGSGLTAWVKTTGGSLNLRAAANGNARVLRTIPNGTAISVSSQGAVWCAVSYAGESGYVMTAFLRFADAAPPAAPTQTPQPTAAPDEPPVSRQAIVTTSGGTLNLRAAASSTARVIMTLPNAAALQVVSQGSAWCGVIYQGTSGYVMTKFITFLSMPDSSPTAMPAPSDPSAFTRVLKSGMTGEDVRWVQTQLAALGYSATATGRYDSATIAAVKAFQKQNGLSCDGLAGAQTFSLLKSGNARRADDQPLSYTTLRIDNTGSGVSALQKSLAALGYSVFQNGTYDVATHDAVVAFQQRNGLVISGIADALTQQVLYGGNGKSYSTAVEALPDDAGRGVTPGNIQLLHWFNEVKPSVSAGQSYTIYDPNTGLSWQLKFYSLGRHADSQPATWRDTQIMNRSFGKGSWTIHPVYVGLPDGRWTMATMHNRPHLYGSITDNGFGGHLCVHFLRDMDECQKNDPNYGVNNQKTLRSAWKALTGETVD